MKPATWDWKTSTSCVASRSTNGIPFLATPVTSVAALQCPSDRCTLSSNRCLSLGRDGHPVYPVTQPEVNLARSLKMCPAARVCTENGALARYKNMVLVRSPRLPAGFSWAIFSVPYFPEFLFIFTFPTCVVAPCFILVGCYVSLMLIVMCTLESIDNNQLGHWTYMMRNIKITRLRWRNEDGSREAVIYFGKRYQMGR